MAVSPCTALCPAYSQSECIRLRTVRAAYDTVVISHLPRREEPLYAEAHLTRYTVSRASPDARSQGKPNALTLQDCLLSFIIHVRYTYTRMVFPIPTPSSACRIGIGREGNDL